MNVNNLIIKALKSLNIITTPVFYNGKERPYITFYTYAEEESFFADNEPMQEVTHITIDLWAEKNFKQTKAKIRTLMKEAGFSYKTSGQELYEPDTKLYHIPLDFQYSKIL